MLLFAGKPIMETPHFLYLITPSALDSWSNLCVSRWRLCSEERHAEVWRPAPPDELVAVVSPPEPPPSWRQVYGRLHRELRVPTGAFRPVHLIIGRNVQQVGAR